MVGRRVFGGVPYRVKSNSFKGGVGELGKIALPPYVTQQSSCCVSFRANLSCIVCSLIRWDLRWVRDKYPRRQQPSVNSSQNQNLNG